MELGTMDGNRTWLGHMGWPLPAGLIWRSFSSLLTQTVTAQVQTSAMGQQISSGSICKQKRFLKCSSRLRLQGPRQR